MYKWLAEKTEQTRPRITNMLNNKSFPMTDIIGRIAGVLHVPVSQIVEFKGIVSDEKKKKWFDEHPNIYEPPASPEEVLTYKPLWFTLDDYLTYLFENAGKEKTEDELLDLIEPFKRRNGLINTTGLQAWHKEIDGTSKRNRVGLVKAKGLTQETRTRLRRDRPVNIRMIYDICNFFGCSVDCVMSYK